MVLHSLIDDTVAPDVLDEFPGPGGYRMPLGPFLSYRLDVFLRLDKGHRSEQTLRDLVAKGDKRLLEADGNSIRVLDIHAFDQAELRPQRIGRSLPGNRGGGKFDILRRHLAMAILELPALPQLATPGTPLLTNSPALKQHETEGAGLGVTIEQVFHHRRQHHARSPRIQVWQPALVAEGSYGYCKRPCGRLCTR